MIPDEQGPASSTVVSGQSPAYCRSSRPHWLCVHWRLSPLFFTLAVAFLSGPDRRHVFPRSAQVPVWRRRSEGRAEARQWAVKVHGTGLHALVKKAAGYASL